MRFFRNLKLKQKLFAVLSFTLMTLIISFLVSLDLRYKEDVEIRKQKAQHLVDVASGIIDGYYRAVESGAMDERSAQEAAKTAIRNVKYGKSGYFWINDVNKILIVHPLRLEREGTNVTDLKDANGVGLYQMFVDKASASDKGTFVTYAQKKPIKDANGKTIKTEISEKISFVKLYKPWNWVIGTGVYLEDIAAPIKNYAIIFGGMSGILMILLIVNFYLLAVSITGPVRAVTDGLRDFAQGKANFSKKLVILSKDEIGTMAFWFNEFIDSLQDTITKITTSSENIHTHLCEQPKLVESLQILSQKELRTASVLEDASTDIKEVTATAIRESDNAKKQTKRAASAVKKLSESSSELKQISEEIEGTTEETASLFTKFTITIDRTKVGTEKVDEIATSAEITTRKLSEALDKVDADLRKYSRFATRTKDDLTNVASSQIPAIGKDVSAAIKSIDVIQQSLQSVVLEIKAIREAVENPLIQKELKSVEASAKLAREVLEKNQYPLERIQEVMGYLSKQAQEALSASGQSEKTFVSSLMGIEASIAMMRKLSTVSDGIKKTSEDQRQIISEASSTMSRLLETTQRLRKTVLEQDRDREDAGSAIITIQAHVEDVQFGLLLEQSSTVQESSEQLRELVATSKTNSERLMETTLQSQDAANELRSSVQNLQTISEKEA